jgi:hypothetical protein
MSDVQSTDVKRKRGQRGKAKVFACNSAKYKVPMNKTTMNRLLGLAPYIAQRSDIAFTGKLTEDPLIAIAFARGVEMLQEEAERDGWTSAGTDGQKIDND